MTQEEFLATAMESASKAQHVWPAYAACEAALESGWGESRLATEANNLFGQKAPAKLPQGTKIVAMQTKEIIRGAEVTVNADWMMFADWQECFAARMALLRRVTMYYLALRAKTGEDFVREVSKVWSTDPHRADKVLAIYEEHKAVLG